jgi:hypothetical protein
VTKTRTVSLTVLLLLLCVPGIAHAERHPTSREKAAIEKAARKAYGDQYFRVRVSRIEVSTVERRWATAVVATFRRKEPRAPANQRMQETFYRTGRGWVAWFSVAMPDVEMPIDVERDLGFAGPAPLFGISGETAVFIVVGVIVLIFLLVFWSRTKDDPGDEYLIVRRIRRPPR